jgi:hypothetical protein
VGWDRRGELARRGPPEPRPQRIDDETADERTARRERQKCCELAEREKILIELKVNPRDCRDRGREAEQGARDVEALDDPIAPARRRSGLGGVVSRERLYGRSLVSSAPSRQRRDDAMTPAARSEVLVSAFQIDVDLGHACILRKGTCSAGSQSR